MDLTKISTHSKKLALTMAGILFLLWLTQPYISKWTDSSKTQPGPVSSQPTQLPVGAMPTDNSVDDPFKEHIQQNGLSNKAPSTTELGSSSTAGADPFKAHLETQKKQAQTSGVSPFGK